MDIEIVAAIFRRNMSVLANDAARRRASSAPRAATHPLHPRVG